MDEHAWRLFVAITVPAEVRAEIVRRLAPLRDVGRARWVSETNLHLTLVFLGHRAPEEVSAIVAGLESVARRTEPYAIALGQPGGFGGGRRGGVLWIGLFQGGAETAELMGELQVLLAPAGDRDAPRRAPRPHLTVAREAAKELISAARDALAGPTLEWRVDRVHLYRSHLGRGAPIYEEIARVPLAARGSGLRSGPCSRRPRVPRGC